MISKYKEFLKESLLDKIEGVNMEDALKNNPSAVLKYAFNTNNNDLFYKALKMGADINSGDGFLLKHYSSKGNYEKVKFLLENGANPNISEYISDAAIVDAAKYGHVDVVKILIDYGACSNSDIDGRDLRRAKEYVSLYIKSNKISDEKKTRLS